MKRILAVLFAVSVMIAFARLHSREPEPSLRVVPESEKTPPGFWEGTAHFDSLYDGDFRISHVVSVSVSPRGNFAIYQNSDERVMLYKRGTHFSKDVTVGRVGIIDTSSWDEQNARATVNYNQNVQDAKYANCPPLVVDLN